MCYNAKVFHATNKLNKKKSEFVFFSGCWTKPGFIDYEYKTNSPYTVICLSLANHLFPSGK